MTINQLRGQMMSDRTFYQAMAMHALLSNQSVIDEYKAAKDLNDNDSFRQELASSIFLYADEMIGLQEKMEDFEKLWPVATRRYSPPNEVLSKVFPPDYWQHLNWTQKAAWIEVAAHCLRLHRSLFNGILETGVFCIIRPTNIPNDLVLDQRLEGMPPLSNKDFLDLAFSMLMMLVHSQDEISDESKIDEV